MASRGWKELIAIGKDGVSLQHDSAGPPTSRASVQAIEELNFPTLQNSPYSPDLAPCDFHVFPKFKEALRGHQHVSIE